MKRKFVIFDVDGTLITKDDVLPCGAGEAIRALRQNGHGTAFFTGRPHSHVATVVRKLDFDGCICTMGAYVELEGNVVQDLRPSPETAKELVRLIRECSLEAAFESEDGIAFDESRPLSDFLCRLKEDFARRGFETNRGIDRDLICFSKLCVWANENSDLARFEKEASRHLKIISRKQNMLELVSAETSIEGSVELMLSHFGVDRADCYAIGDSIKDLPMLRCAAHTSAVGEADDALKAQVEYVTSGIEEGGVINFLRHYHLLSEEQLECARNPRCG